MVRSPALPPQIHITKLPVVVFREGFQEHDSGELLAQAQGQGDYLHMVRVQLLYHSAEAVRPDDALCWLAVREDEDVADALQREGGLQGGGEVGAVLEAHEVYEKVRRFHIYSGSGGHAFRERADAAVEGDDVELIPGMELPNGFLKGVLGLADLVTFHHAAGYVQQVDDIDPVPSALGRRSKYRSAAGATRPAAAAASAVSVSLEEPRHVAKGNAPVQAHAVARAFANSYAASFAHADAAAPAIADTRAARAGQLRSGPLAAAGGPRAYRGSPTTATTRSCGT